MPTQTIGILGGGQLGRMLAAEASLLNIPCIILDPSPSSPAKQILASSEHVSGSFTDPDAIRRLAEKVDLLTVEIEHVNADVLSEIEDAGKIAVHPKPSTIKLLQDKFKQKQHLEKTGSPVSPYKSISSNTEQCIQEASDLLGWPMMMKSRTLAYDGRGNHLLRASEIPTFLASPLGSTSLYAEKLLDFAKEIAVMVVRSIDGSVLSYPVVETIQKDNICHLVLAPLRSSDLTVEKRAKDIAEHAVRNLDGAGVFGVEMFLMPDGSCFRLALT